MTPLDQLGPPERAKPRGFDVQMSFLDHLEAFRWHLVRVVVAFLVALVVAFANLRWLIDGIVLAPLRADFFTVRWLCSLSAGLCPQATLPLALQATDPAEQFTRAILVCAVASLVVVFPYAVWEVWRFVRQGMYMAEIRAVRGGVLIVSGLFLLGVFFGYAIIAPFTLNFFATFQLTPQVQNIWRIGEVISLIVQIALAGGLLFQMPVAAYLLSRLGVLTPQGMRAWRRQAAVAILILAAALTPSPDVVSMLLLAVPMFALYEISIAISARVARARLRESQDIIEAS